MIKGLKFREEVKEVTEESKLNWFKDRKTWQQEIKGGPGSGNVGHAGRPGSVGGSAPSSGGGGGKGPSQHVPLLTSDVEFKASERLRKYALGNSKASNWSGGGHGMWKRPFYKANLPLHEARIFVTRSGKYRLRLYTEGGKETSSNYTSPGGALNAGNKFVESFL